jgi:hypothetical protein
MADEPETLGERVVGMHRIELRRLVGGDLDMLDRYPVAGAADEWRSEQLRLPDWAEPIKVRPTAEQIEWIIDYGAPQVAR